MKRGAIWTVSGGKDYATKPRPVHNGLRTASYLMADKVTTVAKSKLGQRLGSLDAADVGRLDRAILVFLGLTMSPQTEPGH